MPSLIDQMNILKGLPDQSLAAESQNPSGAVPPWMVLSEMNRRKDMRQRYAGQMAMQRPQTTVAEDQLAGLAPPSGAAAGPGAPMMPGPGGVGSPPGMAPSGAPMPTPTGIAASPGGSPPGYAKGGIVGYAYGGYVPGGISDYSSYPDQAALDRAQLDAMYPDPGTTATPMDLGVPAPGAATAPAALDPSLQTAQQYQDLLKQSAEDRKRAPWLALIAAGAGMAAGTSPYALSNIGAGATMGVDAYSTLNKNATADASDALKGLTALQAQDLEKAKFTASQDPNSPQNTPADVNNFKYFNTLSPEDQAAYLRLNQPFGAQLAQQKLTADQDNVDQLADATVNGSRPPTYSGLYHLAGPVQAAIAKKYPDFNAGQAQLEWQAQQKLVNTMNSTGVQQQLAGIKTVASQLDGLQAIADQWRGGNFPILNSANLAAARQGTLGPAAQTLAREFDSQMAETAPAMASVFQKGGTPTDVAMQHADKMFDEADPSQTFDALIRLAKRNVQYRLQALGSATPGGVGGQDRYTPAPVAGTSVNPTGDVIDLGDGTTMQQVK